MVSASSQRPSYRRRTACLIGVTARLALGARGGVRLAHGLPARAYVELREPPL